MLGAMNDVSSDGSHTNGNINSFPSSLSAAAAVAVAFPWVRRVYSTQSGTTIYISPFCKRNVSLLSLLSSAYHSCLGWSL